MSERLLYDKPTAAAQLSISVRVLDRLIKDGQIPTVPIGRRVLVAHDDLERYIERARSAA